MDASWGSPPDSSGWQAVVFNGKAAWKQGSDFRYADTAPAAPTAYAKNFWASSSTYEPGAKPNPPVSETSALNAGIQAISPFAPPIRSSPDPFADSPSINSSGQSIWASLNSGVPSPQSSSTPGFFQEILDSISGTPDSNPFAASIRQPTPAAATAAPLQTTALQTSTTTVAVTPGADKASWSYILQHGNSPWQAIYLDGQQAFRNRSTGQFVKSSRAPSLNGLGAAAPSAGWSFAKVPIFTTMGVGLDVVSIGAAIAIGIYALERFWRK